MSPLASSRTEITLKAYPRSHLIHPVRVISLIFYCARTTMEGVLANKDIWSLISAWLPLGVRITAARTCKKFYREMCLHQGWIDTWRSLYTAIMGLAYRRGDHVDLTVALAKLAPYINGKGSGMGIPVNFRNGPLYRGDPNLEIKLGNLRLAWRDWSSVVSGNDSGLRLDVNDRYLYNNLTHPKMSTWTARWLIIHFLRTYTQFDLEGYMLILMTRCVTGDIDRIFNIHTRSLHHVKSDLVEFSKAGLAPGLTREKMDPFFLSDPKHIVTIAHALREHQTHSPDIAKRNRLAWILVRLRYYYKSASKRGLIDEYGYHNDPPWESDDMEDVREAWAKRKEIRERHKAKRAREEIGE